MRAGETQGVEGGGEAIGFVNRATPQQHERSPLDMMQFGNSAPCHANPPRGNGMPLAAVAIATKNESQ